MINVLIIDDLALAERPAWTQWEAAESRKPGLREKGHLCAIARRKAQLINWLAIDDVSARRRREHASFTPPPPVDAADPAPTPRTARGRNPHHRGKGHLCAPKRRKLQSINGFVIDDLRACRARAHTSSTPALAIAAAGRALTPTGPRPQSTSSRKRSSMRPRIMEISNKSICYP
jgi:hypothetical protein